MYNLSDKSRYTTIFILSRTKRIFSLWTDLYLGLSDRSLVRDIAQIVCISNSKVTKLKQRKRLAIGRMHIIYGRILCLPQFLLFSFSIIVRDCVLYGTSLEKLWRTSAAHEPSICASNKYFTGYPLDFFVFCAVFPRRDFTKLAVASQHDSLSASRIMRKY